MLNVVIGHSKCKPDIKECPSVSLFSYTKLTEIPHTHKYKAQSMIISSMPISVFDVDFIVRRA